VLPPLVHLDSSLNAVDPLLKNAELLIHNGQWVDDRPSQQANFEVVLDHRHVGVNHLGLLRQIADETHVPDDLDLRLRHKHA